MQDGHFDVAPGLLCRAAMMAQFSYWQARCRVAFVIARRVLLLIGLTILAECDGTCARRHGRPRCRY